MTARLPHWFCIGLSVASIGTMIVGFAPSFYARPATMPPMAPAAIAHAVLFSSWMGLFLVQTLLVAAHGVRVHRALGVLGVLLATTMVVTGPPMAVALARRGAPASDPLAFLFVLLVNVCLFGALFAAAINYRHRSEIHRRLMLLAMISLLPPGISRWPFVVRHSPPAMLSVMFVILAAAPVYDLLARRRPHPISLWVGLLVFALLPVQFAFGHTVAWHRVASWLVS